MHSVDGSRTPGYLSRFRTAFRALLLAAGGFAAAACATRSGPLPGPPEPELALEAVERTAPRTPLLLTFAWTLRDGEARFGGEGAVRLEPPYRARLDLFGPRGEGYLVAAAVGDEIRLPNGADPGPLPPPALLWSALGVVRPPDGAALAATGGAGAEQVLEYRAGDERWRYVLENGRLARAELESPGAGRRTVELEGEGAFGVPRRAVYRDWAAFRELILTLQDAEHAEPFPPEIWSPGS